MNKLSPEESPTGIKVKRLNRKPLAIVLVIGLSVLIAFMYLITQSGKRNTEEKETKISKYTFDQTTPKSFLTGRPESGVIAPYVEPKPEPEPEPKEVVPEETEITPQVDSAAAQDISQEQKEIARIRAAKYKRFEQALTAPAKVTSSVKQQKKSNTSQSNANRSKKSSNPFDKMMATREGLGGANVDPNKQEHKAEFYNADQPITEYLQHTRNKQRSEFEIKTGTVIPATLIGGINSDLPGDILAQVSQNVYDTATGNHLLIPQGTKLTGEYDNYITYGQNRALVKWSRLIYPDGSTIELEGMPGIDEAGYAGFEDQVDRHYWQIFGSAILMSAITGVYDYSQGTSVGGFGEVRTAGDTMASAVARELAQASQMLLKKNLDVQPTIKIRPGYRMNVMVKRDIIFPSIW